MRSLVYDTETTGLPLWQQKSDDPGQPEIVQIAAVLLDGDKIVSRMQTVLTHERESEPEAFAAHGISRELASEIGVDPDHAIRMFMDLWSAAEIRVGFNERFDARILRTGIMRVFGRGRIADAWKAGTAFCTMHPCTKICKLPPTEKMMAAGRKHYKNPTLAEAYEAIAGQKMSEAHDAFQDVLATRVIYRHLIERGLGPTLAAEVVPGRDAPADAATPNLEPASDAPSGGETNSIENDW